MNMVRTQQKSLVSQLKCANYMNRHFLEQDRQKLQGKCAKQRLIKKMQIKTTRRYHITPSWGGYYHKVGAKELAPSAKHLLQKHEGFSLDS